MKTKNIILFASLVAALSGCRRGDDLFVNPNQPASGTPASMLTGVEANTTMNYEAGMARIASIFMQYQSGVVAQSTAYDEYIMTSSDMDNYWVGLYVGAMKNCKIMADKYEGKYPYYGGIAKVNMAINLGIATELWGDVPYSQAFNLEGNVTAPQMDKQAAIFASIQTLLDQAIVDFATTPAQNQTVPGGDDLLYAGNMTAWAKAAWVLKARYHNLLSNVDGTAGGTASANNVIADLASGNGFASNADNCYTAHNTGSDPNQWAAFQDGRGYNVACQVLIDSLNIPRNPGVDPRTNWYFDTTGTGNGTPVGNPLGQQNSGSLLGPYLYDVATAAAGGNGEELPTPLITYAEAEFLLAEAYARVGNNANALVELNKAIAASIADVTKGTGTTYVVATASQHTVVTEKWKAMFAQPLESYSDYRRTGWPMLAVRPGGVLSFIPKRFPVDLQEMGANPNAVFIPLSTPVWFGK